MSVSFFLFSFGFLPKRQKSRVAEKRPRIDDGAPRRFPSAAVVINERTYPKSHPSHRIMESSCAEPPQFWHPNASSCCATSSRPCARLEEEEGGR